MYKEIIEAKEEIYQIRIPKEYLNKKIEISISPVEERKDEILEKSFGILRKRNIDPIKWQEEIRSDEPLKT